MFVTTKTHDAAKKVALAIEDSYTQHHAVMSLTTSATTRQQVLAFHMLYEQKIALTPTPMSVSDRERRLRLILEEFLELVESSGFELRMKYGTIPYKIGEEMPSADFDAGPRLEIVHVEGSQQNIVEMAYALGDINYMTHGYAIELGVDLDMVTSEIHASNLTKLGEDGKPIVNGQTVGYRQSDTQYDGAFWCDIKDPDEPGFRPDLPIGKVIKGPNYLKPNLPLVMGLAIKG